MQPKRRTLASSDGGMRSVSGGAHPSPSSSDSDREPDYEFQDVPEFEEPKWDRLNKDIEKGEMDEDDTLGESEPEDVDDLAEIDALEDLNSRAIDSIADNIIEIARGKGWQLHTLDGQSYDLAELMVNWDVGEYFHTWLMEAIMKQHYDNKY